MSTHRNVRLACDNCDRDDKDMITREKLKKCEKDGWQGIGRVQTYTQSCKTYDNPADAPPGYSILDWWTHMGTCPECAKLESESGINSLSTHRNTWKAAERRVADYFGTVRQRLSGSSGREDESASDSKHPHLFIECKYRESHSVRSLFDATAKLAKKEMKTPVVVLVDKGKPGFLVCVHCDHLEEVAGLVKSGSIHIPTSGVHL